MQNVWSENIGAFFSRILCEAVKSGPSCERVDNLISLMLTLASEISGYKETQIGQLLAIECVY